MGAVNLPGRADSQAGIASLTIEAFTAGFDAVPGGPRPEPGGEARVMDLHLDLLQRGTPRPNATLRPQGGPLLKSPLTEGEMRCYRSHGEYQI
jgi:hypothetical protein